MQFSSKLIENAVGEISKLPGIGQKTALRLVMHLLKAPEEQSESLSKAIVKMRHEIQFCKKCHHISDEETCNICNSPRRDGTIICLVEESQDVMAVENTAQYFGHYHVLGGVISPMEGIGPSMLKIDSLVKRITESIATDQPIKEVILALSPTMEGDTTAFYLTKKLKAFEHLKITTIARGIPVGGELEYADEVTLGRSIQARVSFAD
ncbi:recombination mediator RecR [Persicobacter psychrovividus]|uniref:Recombination protein RecR n=1 Tax=Persicobacter psychrovividus TaxID=387638 RepID=A0ABM7VBK3_9BACT|nr:recombination protein RecR [Persicobacter psychrovividus]